MYTFVSIGDLSTSVFNANDRVEGLAKPNGQMLDSQ